MEKGNRAPYLSAFLGGLAKARETYFSLDVGEQYVTAGEVQLFKHRKVSSGIGQTMLFHLEKFSSIKEESHGSSTLETD